MKFKLNTQSLIIYIYYIDLFVSNISNLRHFAMFALPINKNKMKTKKFQRWKSIVRVLCPKQYNIADGDEVMGKSGNFNRVRRQL